MTKRSRGAPAPEFLFTNVTIACLPERRGRRSAERRIQPLSAPRHQMSPSESASGAAPPPNSPPHAGEGGEGARLTALRGGTCQSDRTLRLSPGPRFARMSPEFLLSNASALQLACLSPLLPGRLRGTRAAARSRLRRRNRPKSSPESGNCRFDEADGTFQPVPQFSDLRNRALCDVFFGISTMERAGTGLTDTRELAEQLGGAATFAYPPGQDCFEAELFRLAASAGSATVARDTRPVGTYVLNLLPFASIPQALTHISLNVAGWDELQIKVQLDVPRHGREPKCCRCCGVRFLPSLPQERRPHSPRHRWRSTAENADRIPTCRTCPAHRARARRYAAATECH